MCPAEMNISPETKLNNQSAHSYKSFAASSQLADGSPPSDFTRAWNKNYDLSLFPKEVPLKQLASVSPNVFDNSLSNLKETDKDGARQDTPVHLYFFFIIFAVGVTIALILCIHLGVKGMLVSDHERCTALGQRVLHDRGSSVDAAIAAVLCLGIVHPHVSGIGGGGVMMVHDIHKNETKVINFQGTAPETFPEDMLHNVSELKEGLHVGVPGMLRGLHRAHCLYGSLSWEDVVARAAAVAKEGFSVSFSLADAVSKVKGEKLSQRFRDMFFPGGRPLSSGSFLRMPGLAAVLEAGLANFYDGNFSQEIVDVVHVNGGVLSREDISNYSVKVEKPVAGLFNEFLIQVPPPPSAGAALMLSAINLLEGCFLSKNNNTENQTYQWISEVVKAALAMGSGFADPKYNSSVNKLLSDMLSESRTDVLHQGINYTYASPAEHNSVVHSLQTELQAGHVVVMGPDDLMVSVASSLSRPFGSRLITRSGVILNSLILDFSWPNKATGQQINQRNRIQPGKRPLTSLMPTIVLPAWNKGGIYMALSSSGGPQSFSAITQVLIVALSHHKGSNDTVSQRLHPQLQPNRCLVDQKSLKVLHEESRFFKRVEINSDVRGILRINDIIKPIEIPQLSDSDL